MPGVERTCHACGKHWDIRKGPAPCVCHLLLRGDVTVWCPADQARTALQVCSTCPDFDGCQDREKAELDRLLEYERNATRKHRVKRAS